MKSREVLREHRGGMEGLKVGGFHSQMVGERRMIDCAKYPCFIGVVCRSRGPVRIA